MPELFHVKTGPSPQQVSPLLAARCGSDALTTLAGSEKPAEAFTVPQTQRQAVLQMFSLLVDVLSYHTGIGK